MSKWQPIKTAPRDGTRILIWGRAPDHPDGTMRYKKTLAHVGYWDEIDRAFCFDGADWTGPFQDKPAYWAPLPEPPE